MSYGQFRCTLARALAFVATTLPAAFLVPHSGAAATYAEQVLYAFCQQSSTCSDGVGPSGGVIIDGAGRLYGTTIGGGNHYHLDGTVFQLAPTDGGWTETLL